MRRGEAGWQVEFEGFGRGNAFERRTRRKSRQMICRHWMWSRGLNEPGETGDGNREVKEAMVAECIEHGIWVCVRWAGR